MPPELQREVVGEVEQAKTRSEMRIDDVLRHLGVARSNYFRWKKEQAWLSDRPIPTPPVQAFEALPEEKEAVRTISH